MSVGGLARAMAAFATARDGQGARAIGDAPAGAGNGGAPRTGGGRGRACTELMRAMGGRVAIKTGAEAVFVAILPEKGLGIALKIAGRQLSRVRGGNCASAGARRRAGAGAPGNGETAEPGAEELPRLCDRRNPCCPRLCLNSAAPRHATTSLICRAKRLNFRDDHGSTRALCVVSRHARAGGL